MKGLYEARSTRHIRQQQGDELDDSVSDEANRTRNEMHTILGTTSRVNNPQFDSTRQRLRVKCQCVPSIIVTLPYLANGCKVG